MVVIIDNTVLSNFANAHRTELLRWAFGDKVVMPRQVIEEFNAGVALGRVPVADWSWVRILDLDKSELGSYQKFLRHVGKGEAACLAIAVHRGARLLTDDRRARTIAGRSGISVGGTLGVLVLLVKMAQLTLVEGNTLLSQMIAHGYRSPETDLKNLM